MDPNICPLGEHGFCVHDDTLESIRQPRTHNYDHTRSKEEPDNGARTELPPSSLSPPPSFSLPPPSALSPSPVSTDVPSDVITYAESCSSNDRTDDFEQGNRGKPGFQDAKVVFCQSTVTSVRQGGDSASGINRSSVDRNRQGVLMIRSRSTAITSEDGRLQTGRSGPSFPLSHNTEVVGLCNNVPLLQRSDMIDVDGERGSSCGEDEPKTTQCTPKISALKEGTTSHPLPSTQGRTSFIIKGPPPPDVATHLYDSRRKSCPSAANLETISEDKRRGSQRGCRKEEGRPLKQACAAMARDNSYSSSFVSHQGHDVPESLVWAEEWLKSNDPEPRRNSRATSSVAGRTKAADSHFFGYHSAGPWNKEPAPEERLHSKVTVDTRSVENRAEEQQVEEMTGKPEITRLGRSKQRSVDDLFLYQQTAEATRRRKKSQRNAEEDNLLTGRPKTCTRSTILVEQRRKESRNNKQLPASERLHKEACERRRRQEDRLANLEIAARLRAHPKLTATPKALSQNRGHNVGQRLYNQAFHGQLEARKRERLAYLSPQGATFRPEINPRSVSLARRRRRIAWKEGNQGGKDSTEAEGQVLVEEALLAVGAVYNHRRRQRQQRQEEIDGVLRRSARLNRRSEYLLRRVKQRAVGNKNDEADIGRQGQSRVPDVTVDDIVEDRATFAPKLEALGVSNKILKSRYGQGTVPTMAERAREWETRRIERMNRSVEQQQPYDGPGVDGIRQRNLERDGVNRNHRSTGIDSSGRDIYERTTEYTRQRDQRRKAEREARLEEELANCTFAPSLISKQRSRGKSARTSPPSTTSSSQLDRITMVVSNNDGSTPSCSLSRASTREAHREDPQGQSASTVVEDDALGEHLEGAIMHQALPQGWSAYTTREGRIYYLSEEKGLLQWERPTE